MSSVTNLKRSIDHRYVVVARFNEGGMHRWKRVSGDELVTRRQAIAEVVRQWAEGRRAQIHTPKRTTGA